MRNNVFNTFWHGSSELPPLHHACLNSFVEHGHKVRVFCYRDVRLPSGVTLEDANGVIPESEIFEFHNSYSAFSNIFRYELLLHRGGWWIDTDVYCLADDIPDCAYSWANESEEFINGAILRFPAGDPTLEGILRDAKKIGAAVAVQGGLGPRLLTAHLANREVSDHFGSTSAFYPVHWLEAHRFWMPGDCEFILERSAGSVFLHFWAMMFRYLGIAEHVAPPGGSFLHHIFAGASSLGKLAPLDQRHYETTVASIRAFLGADWVSGLSQRLLGYDVSEFRVDAESIGARQAISSGSRTRQTLSDERS